MENNIEVPSVVDIEWAKQEMESIGMKKGSKIDKDNVYYVAKGHKSNKRIDCIDLSSLPTKIRLGKEIVDWEKVNHEVQALINHCWYTFNIKFIGRNYNSVAKLNIYHNNPSNYKEIYSSTLFNINITDLLPRNETRNYEYNVGDIKGECLIMKKIVVGRKNKQSVSHIKRYKVMCTLTDNIFDISEAELKIFTQSPYRKSRVSELNWLYGCEWLHPYIVDLEFAKTVSRQSSKRIECRCPNPKCEYSKNMFVYELYNRGFNCRNCMDGNSVGEKVMWRILEDSSLTFTPQKTFDGLVGDKYSLRSDFYVPSMNLVIEVQGAQHTRESGLYSTKTTKKYDKIKRDYFKKHNIKFVEIDASKSEAKYIMTDIKNKLPFLNVNPSSVLNYLSSRESNRWDYEDITKMYREGETLTTIGEKYNTSSSCILDIVKRLGVYTSRKDACKKRIRCINTGIVYESLRNAKEWCGLKGAGSMSNYLTGKSKYAGKHPITGEKLQWEYVD